MCIYTVILRLIYCVPSTASGKGLVARSTKASADPESPSPRNTKKTIKLIDFDTCLEPCTEHRQYAVGNSALSP